MNSMGKEWNIRTTSILSERVFWKQHLASWAFLSVICFTRKMSQRATRADPLNPFLVANHILSLRPWKSWREENANQCEKYTTLSPPPPSPLSCGSWTDPLPPPAKLCRPLFLRQGPHKESGEKIYKHFEMFPLKNQTVFIYGIIQSSLAGKSIQT